VSFREGVAAAWWPRDVLLVHGPEAAAWLQGQLSQDVAGLAVGGSAWSLLLQPQGKVDALVRVLRDAEDRFVLDVDAGWAEAVAARLARFKLRTKADVEPLAWRCLAVRGPASHGAVAAVGGAAAGRPVVADWPGLPGVDLLGPGPAVPAGVEVVDAAELEVARVEAGWPALGAELTSDTIPAEAGIVEVAASFTKGCYTGQELVARIDSRGGHVPRPVRGLVAPAPLQVGAPLHDEAGAEVGVVTSAVRSPALGPIGLAVVHRAVEPPAVLAGGVEVRALPLIG
jgi:folate-binding protein YgfZ